MPTRRSRTVTLIHSNEPRVKLVSLRSFHLQSQHGGRLRPARRHRASFARGAHGGGARGARAVRAEPLTKARTRSARVPRPQDRRRRAVFSAGHRLIHERRVPQGSCVSPSLVGRRRQRPETRAVPRGPSAGQGWFSLAALGDAHPSKAERRAGLVQSLAALGDAHRAVSHSLRQCS